MERVSAARPGTGWRLSAGKAPAGVVAAVRVRQQRVSQALDDADDEGRCWRGGVRTSPLTALLQVAELSPVLALDWRGAEGVLRDQELARAVAYEWLGDHSGEATVRRLTLASRAWVEAIGRVPGDVLRTVTAFLVHLGALIAVGESSMTSRRAVELWPRCLRGGAGRGVARGSASVG